MVAPSALVAMKSSGQHQIRSTIPLKPMKTTKDINYANLDMFLALRNTLFCAIDSVVWAHRSLEVKRSKSFDLKETLNSVCKSFCHPFTCIINNRRVFLTYDKARDLAIACLMRVRDIATFHALRAFSILPNRTLFSSHVLPVQPDPDKQHELTLEIWFTNLVFPPTPPPPPSDDKA
jgi:hypothetical protein